jgi:hypothetical protein
MSIAVEYERFILTASHLSESILSPIADNYKSQARFISSGGRA